MSSQNHKEIKIDGVKDIDSLPIGKFTLDSMCPNPSICMIAKRGSGKSWVCRSILYSFRKIPVGLIISPTDKMRSFYGKFIPELYIHYRYKTEIIEKLLMRQRAMIKKMKQKYIQGKKCDPRSFLVMDDCLGDKKVWAKDPMVSELFFNGRHYWITYILTMQYPLGIKPELRSNFDYVFLLADDFISNQKKLYEHYAGMFRTFNIFREIYTKLTQDYGCMVIVNRGARANFLEKIFWYKAEKNDFGHIGCEQYRDFSKNNYDPQHDDNKGIDIHEFMVNKSKRGSSIKVSKMDSTSYK